MGPGFNKIIIYGSNTLVFCTIVDFFGNFIGGGVTKLCCNDPHPWSGNRDYVAKNAWQEAAGQARRAGDSHHQDSGRCSLGGYNCWLLGCASQLLSRHDGTLDRSSHPRAEASYPRLSATHRPPHLWCSGQGYQWHPLQVWCAGQGASYDDRQRRQFCQGLLPFW